jgi:hydroxymethylbilane synthase
MPGFELAAIMKREDPRDAFVSVNVGSVSALPHGARVGTSSLRRQAQLRALRPDLDIQPLRGNVDTRLRKLESGEFAAIILAVAGLARLGRTEFVREIISTKTMCPAAGQGALAIEIRKDDADARATTACERAALNALGGGCQVPIGAHAEITGGKLRLTAIVARPDGSELLRAEQIGTDPEHLGSVVGQELLGKGAQRILDDVYRSGAAVPQQP